MLFIYFSYFATYVAASYNLFISSDRFRSQIWYAGQDHTPETGDEVELCRGKEAEGTAAEIEKDHGVITATEWSPIKSEAEVSAEEERPDARLEERGVQAEIK